MGHIALTLSALAQVLLYSFHLFRVLLFWEKIQKFIKVIINITKKQIWDGFSCSYNNNQLNILFYTFDKLQVAKVCGVAEIEGLIHSGKKSFSFHR